MSFNDGAENENIVIDCTSVNLKEKLYQPWKTC